LAIFRRRLCGGTLTFFLYPFIRHIPGQVLIGLDAAGLAFCAVAGAEKALAYGVHPFIAVLMGTITGVGGGSVRDVLLAHVPAVLRVEIYATAALVGSVVVVAGRRAMRADLAAIFGGAMCFALRLVSVWQHWHLPTAAGL
jgi:uncharacterized membrane protein YeiH